MNQFDIKHPIIIDISFINYQGGFYVLSLIDEYIAGYPLLIVGILQVIVVPWVYGK